MTDVWRQLPNILTFGRVLAVPVMVAVLLAQKAAPESVFWSLVGTSLFFVAAMTDWLDGVLARRWEVVSRFGKLADPLADKLLTMACFVMFVDLQWLPGWLVVLILVRETAVNSLRMIALDEGVLIAAGQGGKWKTVLQFCGIGLLLLHPAFAGIEMLASWPLRQAGEWTILGSTLLSWISGVEYFVAYFRAPVPDAAD